MAETNIGGLRLLAVALLVGAMAGCATSNAAETDAGIPKRPQSLWRCPPSSPATTAVPSTGQPLRVVTTVAPITSIVSAVAGTAAHVVGLIPEGQDSHTFEPKPSAAKILAGSDVIFVNGLHLDNSIEALAKANKTMTATLVDLGTETLTEDDYIYDFSFPKSAGHPNPHVWTNPPMAKCYAQIAADVLGRADPVHADVYRANADRLNTKLDELDQLMVKATASMTARNRALLTYHDAYAYFAEHYGWKVIGAVQVSSFEDPTPREVTKLIGQIRTSGVPAIFGSEVFPSPVLEQLGKETGVRYVDTLRDDDLPGGPGDADHSYIGLMKFDFVTMVSNLGGDASGLKAFDASLGVVDGAEYPQ